MWALKPKQAIELRRVSPNSIGQYGCRSKFRQTTLTENDVAEAGEVVVGVGHFNDFKLVLALLGWGGEALESCRMPFEGSRE